MEVYSGLEPIVMRKLQVRLLHHAGGNITIILSLMAVPLALVAGLAIDRVRMDAARAEMQAAIDGATLAASMADNRTTKQREDLAKKYFKSNFYYAQKLDVNFSVKVTAKSVAATASLNFPTSLMALAGINATELDVTSEVMRAGDSWAEVALVADYSGSMKDNNKYIRMSKAATTMVDSLSADIGADHLQVGLVPFSAMVYTSMASKYVTQPSPTTTWTGCTQDRQSAYNTTVNTPSPGDATSKWGYYDTGFENSGVYGCATYNANNLSILPLTSDIAAVKAKLASMVPLGNTNIPLGAEFGWNLLDPALPYNEGAPYGNKKNHKYLILLTDGVQTSKQWGPGGTHSTQNGDDNLLKLCSGITAAGITIFMVAYDVTDPAVTALLKQCGGDHYYQPDVSETAVSEVFTAITQEINKQTVRLSR